jgi:hypothetical protein
LCLAGGCFIELPLLAQASALRNPRVQFSWTSFRDRCDSSRRAFPARGGDRHAENEECHPDRRGGGGLFRLRRGRVDTRRNRRLGDWRR